MYISLSPKPDAMKKILLIAVLAAGALQLKAQQTYKVPELKIPEGNFFKPDSALSNYKFRVDAVTTFQQPAVNAIVVNSNMPVLKITRSNIDHMPIYNPAQSNMHYDMLIKKVEVNPVAPAETVAP